MTDVNRCASTQIYVGSGGDLVESTNASWIIVLRINLMPHSFFRYGELCFAGQKLRLLGLSCSDVNAFFSESRSVI